MAIPVQCPRCNRVYQLKDEMAGQQVRCQCTNVLTIPQPAQANMALMNLLSEELTRPLDAPPVRKAPTVMPPREKPSGPKYSTAPQVPDPTKAPERQFVDPFASPAERAAARRARRPAGYNAELHTVFVIITGVVAILFAIGAGIITGISAMRATEGISEINDLGKEARAAMDWPIMIGAWLMLACSIILGVAGIGILCRQYWAKTLGTLSVLLILVGIWVFHGYVAVIAIEFNAYKDDKDAAKELPVKISWNLLRIYISDKEDVLGARPGGLLGFLSESDDDTSLAVILIKIILWGLLYSLAPAYILWWMIWASETDLTGW
jgi:hypothetical protein